MRAASIALLLLSLSAACATDRQFAPRENRNGEAPTGAPAAVYALAPPLQGEVRVWSDGAARTTEAGAETRAETTRIHIGFELENSAAQPLVLDVDALRLQGIVGEGVSIDALPPIMQSGVTEAPPGKTVRCDFQFDPGTGLMPRAIEAFELRWAVRIGEQHAQQVTPFRPWIVERPSPYWDDPWPFWGGFGWHRCR